MPPLAIRPGYRCAVSAWPSDTRWFGVGPPFRSGVPGVEAVDDQLKVRLMGVDARADADTEAAVLAALIVDDNVDAADVEVKSRDGDVTLSGLVEVRRQRDRAERIALGVGGVNEVRNEIKIWLPEHRRRAARVARYVPGVCRVPNRLAVTPLDAG